MIRLWTTTGGPYVMVLARRERKRGYRLFEPRVPRFLPARDFAGAGAFALLLVSLQLA